MVLAGRNQGIENVNHSSNGDNKSVPVTVIGTDETYDTFSFG